MTLKVRVGFFFLSRSYKLVGSWGRSSDEPKAGRNQSIFLICVLRVIRLAWVPRAPHGGVITCATA
ncbi:hypothetical protein PanWU01x14_315170 [Parasponia andersonii]|uniref:Uncharacterized protein n=1 Tax=Parasponia andersonii TaxID=3476 RepID=A0A2P5ANG8_PARAD|nr:hypothetical protein PanWU01x14_315170 [Parasponia andersonii]